MLGSRFITAVLIVMWLVTPDLLCLIPGVEMTMDEHECCEKMGSDCGKVPMPDMHTCCRTATSSNAVIVARTTDYPELRATLLPAVIPEIDLSYNNTHSVHGLRFESPT